MIDSYWFWLAVAVIGKGMDILSTWIVSPDLKLEKNPIFKKLGWKWMILLTLAACLLSAIDQRLSATLASSGAVFGMFNCFLLRKCKPFLFFAFSALTVGLIIFLCSIGLWEWALIGILSWLISDAFKFFS